MINANKSHIFFLLTINRSSDTRLFYNDRKSLEYRDAVAPYAVSQESGGPQVDAAGPELRSSSGTSDTSGHCGRRDSLVRSGVRSLLLVVP